MTLKEVIAALKMELKLPEASPDDLTYEDGIRFALGMFEGTLSAKPQMGDREVTSGVPSITIIQKIKKAAEAMTELLDILQNDNDVHAMQHVKEKQSQKGTI